MLYNYMKINKFIDECLSIEDYSSRYFSIRIPLSEPTSVDSKFINVGIDFQDILTVA